MKVRIQKILKNMATCIPLTPEYRPLDMQTNKYFVQTV